MLTSSTLYRSLSLSSAPHLYANIFRACFDSGPIRRSSASKPTDSHLAAELVSRYRLLRRVRGHDLSHETLKTDYCTAMRMLLESDGPNQVDSSLVGLTKFVADHLEHCLEEHLSDHYCQILTDDNIKLAIELFVLILSRTDITAFSQGFREHLLLVSRPFILSKSVVAKSPRAPSCAPTTSHEENEYVLCHHSTAPDGCDRTPYHDPSAAIVLTFVLKELDVLEIPPHLPVDRNTAEASGRSGPTQQDYLVVAKYQTPLFGDDRPLAERTWDSSRSARHGLGFHFCEDSDLQNPDVPGLGPDVHAYTSLPYLLTGVWEGIYMLSGPNAKGSEDPAKLSDLASPLTPDFLCRTPMQCSLSLYFCFDGQEAAISSGFTPNVGDWTILSNQIITSEVGTPYKLTVRQENAMSSIFTIESSSSFHHIAISSSLPSDNLTSHFFAQDCLTVSGRRLPYEKFVFDPSHESQTPKDPSQATDCILIGQTLEEHEQAWGAYKYVGRLSKSGQVTLKREPKNASDAGFGNWIFEGHLHYGAALVGIWRSGEPGEDGVRGIFSLRKTEMSS
ncbi:hypothetical protein K435DRAFT_279585 [Dendrothele bispora CBS 962.96]|uniref:Uncharacterized protein n=1 Tax=Dendrothele bispora (strain CBS 962.96) TaxID=1314807 RepID=A0A4S8MLA1_DENBC|nr:hypothetical protein K435DRAFT_279585 [Dendrothele bispora CBS 962.96]